MLQMAPKPSTLFVLIAAAGSKFFKAEAEQYISVGRSDVSPWSRIHSSMVHFLSDFAMISVVPATSVLRARSTASEAESLTSLAIAKEVGLTLILTLLSGWFVLQILPHWIQVAWPAGQPTKGACPAGFSPQKGLTTLLSWGPWTWPGRVHDFIRRRVQRRRLYIYRALVRLESIVPWLCGSPSPLTARHESQRASAPRSHGMHDWHEAKSKGFLMPVDVAACRSSPEVSAALQRLVADRWWFLEVPEPPLESVPEDECLLDGF